MRPEVVCRFHYPPNLAHWNNLVRMVSSTMNKHHVHRNKKPPVFTGPRERISQMLIRARQLEGNPKEIARGMAVGIFISITPIIPFQTVAAILLAFLVRGSKSAAVLGTWLSNPLTIPFVYYVNYKVGCGLLGYESAVDRIVFDSLMQLMELGLEVTWTMIVGGVVVGAAFGVFTYFFTLHLFVTFRVRSGRNRNDPGIQP